MECVRSSPVKSFGIQWPRPAVDDNSIVPHSAPSTCSIFSSSCRRAASFPMAHATALPSALKVRSQSESAGLNSLHFKVSRSIMLSLQNSIPEEVRFFAQQPDMTQSDSDGDDSMTSSDSGNTSEDEQPYTDTDFNETLPFDDSALNKSFEQVLSVTSVGKKHVRFADDCGGTLESVRIITEPSDCPPRISPSIIRRYRKASKAFMRALASQHSGGVLSTDEDSSDDEDDGMYHNKKHASWKIGFTQPASEYVRFRNNLEKNKVALENVMLRNDHCKMLGTIKVANVHFEKHVFVRFTCDGWKSYLDRPAVYQASSSKAFDTFGFEIEIPMNEGGVDKIEFCICYSSDGVEHWDSNDGQNYILVSENQPPKVSAASSDTQAQRRNSDSDDAYRMNYDNWTRFASWRNLSTEGPYW